MPRSKVLSSACICLASLAEVALAADLTAPVTLAGKWQSSTGGFEGDVFVQIDQIGTNGAFTGRVYFLRGVHCVARGEPIVDGHMSGSEVTFSASASASRLCRGLAFHLKFGGERLLEGKTGSGDSVWLERSTSAPPSSRSTASFGRGGDVVNAGGKMLGVQEVSALLTNVRFKFRSGEWTRMHESRANGVLWVILDRPVGPGWNQTGEWRIREDGAYCAKIPFPMGGEDSCRKLWGFEGNYFINAAGGLSAITFVD